MTPVFLNPSAFRDDLTATPSRLASPEGDSLVQRHLVEAADARLLELEGRLLRAERAATPRAGYRVAGVSVLLALLVSALVLLPVVALGRFDLSVVRVAWPPIVVAHLPILLFARLAYSFHSSWARGDLRRARAELDGALRRRAAGASLLEAPAALGCSPRITVRVPTGEVNAMRAAVERWFGPGGAGAKGADDFVAEDAPLYSALA